MGNVYKTKEVAQKINKPIVEIYKTKNKYKHLFQQEHCVLINKNVLLWTDLGIQQLNRAFLLSDAQKLDEQKKRSFTQSDFDKVIADLESQISELKTKYPEFVNTNQQVQQKTNPPTLTQSIIGCYPTPEESARAYDLKAVELYGEECTTNFPVEGVKTKVLFPDYPATKRHKVSNAKSVEPPMQLSLVTNSGEAVDDSQETVFDRMRAFAIANGIELKTMKTA